MSIVFNHLRRQHHEDHCHFKLTTNSPDKTIYTHLEPIPQICGRPISYAHPWTAFRPYWDQPASHNKPSQCREAVNKW